MSSEVKEFFNRIMVQPAVVSGHVTGVTVDPDTGQQKYATVAVGGLAIQVRLSTGSPSLAYGDQVRLEQYGNAATAEYRLAETSGARPGSGAFGVLNDNTPLGNGTYMGGDVVMGKLTGGNVFVEYDSGRLFHRIDTEVYGIEYPDGSQVFGHMTKPIGGDWTPDGPNVYIDATSIKLRNADVASIDMDTDGTIWAKKKIVAGAAEHIAALDGEHLTWRIYAGSATPESAPFRVDLNGNLVAAKATIAGEIDVQSGQVSGDLIVSGSLQNATSGAHYKLDSAGLKTYDSSGVQRTAILNDGSGWLGASNVLYWTTAGVVTLNGSAVLPGTITGGKLNTYNVPAIDGLTITNNSPSSGYVAWNSFTLTHQGTSYTITAGNSNKKYIYWKKSISATALQVSDTAPIISADQFMVIYNNGGIGIASLFSNFIYADYLAVDQLAAITADLGNITAGTITGAVIQTGTSGARIVLNASKLSGYDSSNVEQVYISATNGKLYAGGGNVVLDANGVAIAPGTAYSAVNSYKFISGSNTSGGLYNYLYGGANQMTVQAISVAGNTSNGLLYARSPSGYQCSVGLDCMIDGTYTARSHGIFLTQTPSTGWTALIAAPNGVTIDSDAISLTGPITGIGAAGDADRYIGFTRDSGDQGDAGKIGYKAFDSTALCIVGAGTDGYHRKVRVWDLLQVGTVPYSSGSSYPSSPVTGQHFFHTGYNCLMVYNGSYWLTAHEYCFYRSGTATASSTIFPLGILYDYINVAVITRYNIRITPTGTNDASNYWNIFIRWVNQPYNNAANALSWNTASMAAGTGYYYNGVSTWTSPVDRKSWLDIVVNKGAGSPTQCSVDCTVYYRLALL